MSTARTCSVREAAAALGLTPERVRQKLEDPSDPLVGIPPRSDDNPGRAWLVDADTLERVAAARRAAGIGSGPTTSGVADPAASGPAGHLPAGHLPAGHFPSAAELGLRLADALARAAAAERETARLRAELADALDAVEALRATLAGIDAAGEAARAAFRAGLESLTSAFTSRRRAELLSEALAARDD